MCRRIKVKNGNAQRDTINRQAIGGDPIIKHIKHNVYRGNNTQVRVAGVRIRVRGLPLSPPVVNLPFLANTHTDTHMGPHVAASQLDYLLYIHYNDYQDFTNCRIYCEICRRKFI